MSIWGTMKIAACALLCLTGPGLAASACLFTAECFEADGCAESGFTLDLADADDAGRVVAATEFGDLTGRGLERAAVGVSYVLEGAGAVYLLTMSGTDARLSVHMEGPIVATYLGTCDAGQ
ncbi:hypothetical protein E4Z66_02930 [Aliishimia ponticola]|uniref:Uncharacterized protein n=1 Tax=Aliishimia ponticola TaxID=2499833 RepID=A0A4S4NG31_9RHOB|nr:hypothetical protein [Aliishimia ponticola]THH38539.1 hypothetical protein E4Z66_02930 [Aliishimia ponticola]